jgi:2-hydroxy-4-(methylsulfanyl)butanoate S-methyltransferase
MHIAILPDGPLEGLALTAGLVPTPFFAGLWGIFYSRCVLSATRLGVLDALEARPQTTAALARAIDAQSAGLEPLLKGLNGIGLVRHRDGEWSLTRTSRRWLLRSSKGGMRDAVLFLELPLRWMDRIEDVVRTGQVQRIHEGGLTPAEWELYMRGLAAFARMSGAEVVRRVRLGGAPRRLLDVGGGHGIYSVAFCRRFPELTAEVLDLAEAVESGRRIIAEEGQSGRVKHRAGDMRTESWGEDYDVVLLFNVLHNATEGECQNAVRRASAALRPGGTLVILENRYEETRGNLDAARGFGELFHFLISGARAWPEPVMKGWLAQAGFEKIAATQLRLAPSVLLTARRPG